MAAKKQHREKQPEPIEVPHHSLVEREMFGVGLEKHEGKWLAVVVSTRGTVEVLNPQREGQALQGESKALALSRALKEFTYRCTGKRA